MRGNKCPIARTSPRTVLRTATLKFHSHCHVLHCVNKNERVEGRGGVPSGVEILTRSTNTDLVNMAEDSCATRTMVPRQRTSHNPHDTTLIQ